jgi:hypothetical protein
LFSKENPAFLPALENIFWSPMISVGPFVFIRNTEMVDRDPHFFFTLWQSR